MGDWLTLTAADIEAALVEAAAHPATPRVLRIAAADLPPAPPPPPVRGAPLRITGADLAPEPPQPAAGPDLAPLEQLMFDLVNQARRQHLPQWLQSAGLRWHPGLAAVARGHAADMGRRQYLEHTTPEGVTAATRLARYGIHYLACGENIGVVYGPASQGVRGIREIQAAFMNQPRSLTNHRGNVLNPIWTHVGIGAARGGPGVLIVTQSFISAPGTDRS